MAVALDKAFLALLICLINLPSVIFIFTKSMFTSVLMERERTGYFPFVLFGVGGGGGQANKAVRTTHSGKANNKNFKLLDSSFMLLFVEISKDWGGKEG